MTPWEMTGDNLGLKPGCFVEYWVEVKEPRFSELNKVRVNDGKNKPYQGYMIKTLFKDGRWIYKISISEDPRKTETWDNWD